ncbi:uncharacterized protein ACRADG_000694 isoform 1-T2 [Cochliomyia hominivorax]
MICEPNLNLPQRVDLNNIKESRFEIPINIKEHPSSKNDKHKVSSHEQNVFNVLPLFKNQFYHLNDKLSLNNNNYLACRWNSFLNNIPENYIRIRLYLDYKKSLETHIVRRKQLNGNFYGIDFKLAPIPQFSDQRK